MLYAKCLVLAVRSSRRGQRTLHHLLDFLPIVESTNIISLAKSMNGKYVESCNALKAFDSDRALIVLNCEVRANGTRSVADECISRFESVLIQKLVKQVV